MRWDCWWCSISLLFEQYRATFPLSCAHRRRSSAFSPGTHSRYFISLSDGTILRSDLAQYRQFVAFLHADQDRDFRFVPSAWPVYGKAEMDRSRVRCRIRQYGGKVCRQSESSCVRNVTVSGAVGGYSGKACAGKHQWAQHDVDARNVHVGILYSVPGGRRVVVISKA